MASDGAQANSISFFYPGGISGDGRFVVFLSSATNLVPNDTNGLSDAFVHDRLTGQTERVSIATDRAEAAGASQMPSMSADGRYVVFSSDAANLVPDDNNGCNDVFVRDRLTGQTSRVSLSSDGTEANGATEAWGSMPSISADGRYVAFCSEASNLVPNDTNDLLDVFVHDRLTGETERASVATDGTQAAQRCWYPALSADGRYVVFSCDGNELAPDVWGYGPHVYLRDRQAGTTVYVGDGFSPSISGDGRYVAMGNGSVWVVDTQTWEAVRVDVASDGTPGDDWDWAVGQAPAVTPDGQLIAFHSQARNLVPGDTNGTQDVFVHDRQTGATVRVSVASDGTEADDTCWFPAISADGRFVSFESGARNLVDNDTNGVQDIFVRDRLTADFEAAPTAGPVPLRVEFTDHSVNVSPSLVWDFGDGGTSAEQNPTHVYEGAPGRYTVSLTCSGRWGEITETRPDYVAITFSDAAPDVWAWQAALDCFVAGIVCGYGDGLYHPELPVTRDQMAVYIARALAGGEENVPEAGRPRSFLDVRRDHWAFDHIEYCVENGVLAGYGLALYHPDYVVTRDQMAVYVARAMVAPGGDAAIPDPLPPATFPDVPDSFWSCRHVEYCVSEGVVAGYGDGLYHPEYAVTRDQMAVYVARAFGLP
jgi:Tol biopolymer transport system component